MKVFPANVMYDVDCEYRQTLTCAADDFSLCSWKSRGRRKYYGRCRHGLLRGEGMKSYCYPGTDTDQAYAEHEGRIEVLRL